MTDDVTEWETRSTAVPYEGDEFAVRRDSVVRRDEEFATEYLETADAVTVLAFTRDDRLVLVQEWRQSVKHADLALPSGQIEPEDDGPADAARRELREETGYEAESLSLLGRFEPLNSLLDASIYYFVADDCRATGDRNPDADEDIRTRLHSLEQVREMIASGQITDMKTALAVLYYSMHA